MAKKKTKILYEFVIVCVCNALQKKCLSSSVRGRHKKKKKFNYVLKVISDSRTSPPPPPLFCVLYIPSIDYYYYYFFVSPFLPPPHSFRYARLSFRFCVVTRIREHFKNYFKFLLQRCTSGDEENTRRGEFFFFHIQSAVILRTRIILLCL